MLEHIADFTAWPILTGILVGYIANRIMSGEGKADVFANAIRHDFKSPSLTTKWSDVIKLK